MQISKASASNALRNLEIRGNVEYVTLPGDRKRYFQIKRQNAFAIIEDVEKKMRGSRGLFAEILRLKADKNSANSKFLSDLVVMIDILLGRLNDMREEFLKNK